VILELMILSSKKMLHPTSPLVKWKPNLVFSYFMVSATYVPSLDVLEQ